MDLIVIDTRARNNGWYTSDGPDSLLRSRIQQAISPVGLDPTVGLMEFEWVQPMDRPPFELIRTVDICKSGGNHRATSRVDGVAAHDAPTGIAAAQRIGRGRRIIS